MCAWLRLLCYDDGLSIAGRSGADGGLREFSAGLACCSITCIAPGKDLEEAMQPCSNNSLQKAIPGPQTTRENQAANRSHDSSDSSANSLQQSEPTNSQHEPTRTD